MEDNRIFPDWLTAYLEYIEETEPPVLFKIWCGISAICACLERKCYLSWERDIYPNMYIILVGPPGCRKGTAMRPIQEFLAGLGVNLSAEAITREALIKDLSTACTEQKFDAKATEMLMHTSMTICSEELTVFLSQNDWRLISDLNNWFDCPATWTYRTKTMGEDDLLGVWVNMLGATTPEYIESELPRGATGGGLVSRIVFVFGDRKSKLCPDPVATVERDNVKKQLARDLSQIKMLRGSFSYTEEYHETYHNWYIEQESNPPFLDNNFLGYNDRRATHLRKMTMAFCASRTDSMLLDIHDFNRAKDLLEETEKYMPFVFSGRGRLPLAGVLARIMEELQRKGTLTSTDIMRRYIKDITIDDLDQIVKSLVRGGYCKDSYNGNNITLEWLKTQDI